MYTHTSPLLATCPPASLFVTDVDAAGYLCPKSIARTLPVVDECVGVHYAWACARDATDEVCAPDRAPVTQEHYKVCVERDDVKIKYDDIARYEAFVLQQQRAAASATERVESRERPGGVPRSAAAAPATSSGGDAVHSARSRRGQQASASAAAGPPHAASSGARVMVAELQARLARVTARLARVTARLGHATTHGSETALLACPTVNQAVLETINKILDPDADDGVAAPDLRMSTIDSEAQRNVLRASVFGISHVSNTAAKVLRASTRTPAGILRAVLLEVASTREELDGALLSAVVGYICEHTPRDWSPEEQPHLNAAASVARSVTNQCIAAWPNHEGELSLECMQVGPIVRQAFAAVFPRLYGYVHAVQLSATVAGAAGWLRMR